MNANLKLIVVAVVGLLVGAAAGGGFGMMQVEDVKIQLMAVMQEKDAAVATAGKLQRQTGEATTKWGKELGRLVDAAIVPVPAAQPAPAPAPQAGQPPAPASQPAAAPDPAKLVDGARAILATRDGYRAALDGVRAQLDGDMDQLAIELGSPTPDPEKINQMLQSLKQNWPSKGKSIEEAARKLLIDLGIAQPAPQPAAAPGPAAAPAAAPAAPAPAEKK